MILLTNSSSPPSAMISVTPPVFTELGGGRREFLEFTPWREQQDRERLGLNPIRGSYYHVSSWCLLRVVLTLHERNVDFYFYCWRMWPSSSKQFVLEENQPVLRAGLQRKGGCTCRSRIWSLSLLSRHPSVKSSEELWRLRRVKHFDEQILF